MKTGRLNLKLLRQLYWLVWNRLVTLVVMNYWKFRGPTYERDRFQQQISRLAFVAIALTPAPLTPITKGGFPKNTFRGQVCLLQEKIESEEDFKKGFLERFPQVVEIIYTCRFVRQVNKFVDGHCPGGKICSIGKYRRNILGLQSSYWAALCGASIPLVSSDRSSCTDDGPRYIRGGNFFRFSLNPLMQLMLQVSL